MQHRELTQETVLALFPWEDVGLAEREQAEAEIHADGEYQAWLDGILADADRALTGDCPPMDELTFMEFTLYQLVNGHQPATVALSVEALAAMEDEQIGADFCRQPWLY